MEVPRRRTLADDPISLVPFEDTTEQMQSRENGCESRVQALRERRGEKRVSALDLRTMGILSLWSGHAPLRLTEKGFRRQSCDRLHSGGNTGTMRSEWAELVG